jgi:peptide/nickel transport system permease protein
VPNVTDIADPALPLTSAPEGGEVTGSGSIGRLVVRTFLENRLAVIGLSLVVIVAVFCFIVPFFYHSNQIQVSLINTNLRPGAGHPLGTDENGYDILGRLMKGGQISLEVGFATAIIATAIGVIYGAVSGYFGKWVDTILMRIVDIGLAIPVVFLFIFLSLVYQPSVLLLILILSGLSWLGPSRLVRGETLSLRTREYVQAVKVMGGGSRRVILRHIIPNTIGTIIVNATFQIADAILVLATLNYLGFSLPPPTATWGGMLSNGTAFLQDGYWWQVYPPLIMIILTVVAFNFIGDALRDSFEVRLQKR